MSDRILFGSMFAFAIIANVGSAGIAMVERKWLLAWFHGIMAVVAGLCVVSIVRRWKKRP